MNLGTGRIHRLIFEDRESPGVNYCKSVLLSVMYGSVVQDNNNGGAGLTRRSTRRFASGLVSVRAAMGRSRCSSF